MKRLCFLLMGICVMSWVASAAIAQEQRRPTPEEGLRPAPGDPAHRPREEGRPRDEGGPRPEGRPRDGEGLRPEGRRDGGRPGMPEGVTPDLIRRYMELQRPSPQAQQVDAMRNYLDVFDRYSRLSRDPTSAGVAAVVTAGEVLRARGADTAITYFTKVLPEVKNDAVQRAIRLQLIELYKMSGQQDKALEQLQELMVSAPQNIGNPQPDRPQPRQN